MFEIVIVIFLSILIWLLFNKILAEKKINGALRSVSKEQPVYLNIAISDIVRFCHKKYIEFYKADEILVISYEGKCIYVRTLKNENEGNTKFYII